MREARWSRDVYTFRLIREGIGAKVAIEHRESETEDPTRVLSSFAMQHKAH